MPDVIYFDTCIFIEILQKSIADRYDACEDLRAKAERDELVIVTSALTITEVNKLPDSPKLPEEQSRMILEFFESPYIAVRPVDRATAEDAHVLTRTHGLTNIDAVHVATAIRHKATVMYTYDGIKPKRKGLLKHSLKIGTPGLLILQPPDPDAKTLFDKEKMADKSKPSALSLPHIPLAPEKALAAAMITPLPASIKKQKKG